MTQKNNHTNTTPSIGLAFAESMMEIFYRKFRKDSCEEGYEDFNADLEDIAMMFVVWRLNVGTKTMRIN